MVWTASGKLEGKRRKAAGSTGLLTLYFSKGALSNFLDDSVLAELGWRIGPLLFRSDRHCEYGGGGDVGERGWRRGTISRSLCRVGINEMKGEEQVAASRVLADFSLLGPVG